MLGEGLSPHASLSHFFSNQKEEQTTHLISFSCATHPPTLHACSSIVKGKIVMHEHTYPHADQVWSIETHGIDAISQEERHGTPLETLLDLVCREHWYSWYCLWCDSGLGRSQPLAKHPGDLARPGSLVRTGGCTEPSRDLGGSADVDALTSGIWPTRAILVQRW